MQLSSLLLRGGGARRGTAAAAAVPQSDAAAQLACGEALLDAGDAAEARQCLRSAPRHAASPAELIEITRKAAAKDAGFAALVAAGDAARDNRRWTEGERCYAEALALYPAHAGYLVQYGHCLKEQEKFAEAEIAYRSAVALGASHDDVARHLAFVAGRQGYEDWQPPVAEPAATWMDVAPTRADIDLVYRLLTGEPADTGQTLDILRRAKTVREVFIAVIEQPGFRAANRDLLGLIADGSLQPEPAPQ